MRLDAYIALLRKYPADTDIKICDAERRQFEGVTSMLYDAATKSLELWSDAIEGPPEIANGLTACIQALSETQRHKLLTWLATETRALEAVLWPEDTEERADG